ncbi:MAG: GAF domain-containing protein [candidate division WS1 bacterium]|nr:GAF domain-containing protein [candidate division WS1 bacterium]
MPDRLTPEDPGSLRKERERYRMVVTELQTKIRELEEEIQTTTAITEMPTVVVTRPELHNTLMRLVNKIAMIVQAEEVLLLLYQPELGELAVLPPSLGITEEQAAQVHLPPEQGITGLVYRTGESVLYNDAINDPRASQDKVSLLRVRNGICVPLTIKQRDEEERVITERVIGVMHVCNKRYDQEFNEDDVRLLEMLAEQAAAIISNAQLYIELTEEKARLEQTFETLHAGVIATDANGRLRLLNRAAAQMLGLPASAYEGQLAAQVIPDEQVRNLLERSLAEKKELAEEVNAEGDRRIYKGETSLMRDEARRLQAVVAIFNDITEIRQVERMKTAFVSTVSHELRTPLTSIKGFISTLLDDTEGMYDDVTRREFYEIIDQECDRLTRLISDLLNVSRIESGRALDMHLAEVDLHKTIGRVLQAQQQYTSRHQLVNDIPEDFSTIEGDGDKIYQVIDNLVGNAVKYSPEGGVVKVTAEDEGGTVRLEISDEGLGIPERHRDKIFERFHMVDDDVDHKAVKGTGIGLYLVRHLTRAHGGDVWLKESEVGKGSTFCVRLPKEAQVPEQMSA